MEDPAAGAFGERFTAAVREIDRVNGEDPRTEIVGGRAVPRELAYAWRMSEMLSRLAPDAPELLRLAARAQHIARWRVPRDEFPRDRSGYKRWRAGLLRMHAEMAGEILRSVGYEESEVERVGELIRKQGLRRDAEVQTLEDVACLVFLQYYLEGFAPDHEEAKVVDILRKSWAKMSPAAREFALELPLEARSATLVARALADHG